MVSNRRSDREDFKFGQKKLKFWREIWILAGNLNFFAIFGQICHLLGIKLSLELIASCFGYQINPGTSRVPIWAKKFQILAGNLNFFGQNCNIASKYSLWQVTASHNYAYWVCSGYQNYPLAKQSTNLCFKIHILAGNLNFWAKIAVINPYKHSTYANLVCHHLFEEALDSHANQWGKFLCYQISKPKKRVPILIDMAGLQTLWGQNYEKIFFLSVKKWKKTKYRNQTARGPVPRRWCPGDERTPTAWLLKVPWPAGDGCLTRMFRLEPCQSGSDHDNVS